MARKGRTWLIVIIILALAIFVLPNTGLFSTQGNCNEVYNYDTSTVTRTGDCSGSSISSFLNSFFSIYSEKPGAVYETLGTTYGPSIQQKPIIVYASRAAFRAATDNDGAYFKPNSVEACTVSLADASGTTTIGSTDCASKGYSWFLYAESPPHPTEPTSSTFTQVYFSLKDDSTTSHIDQGYAVKRLMITHGKMQYGYVSEGMPTCNVGSCSGTKIPYTSGVSRNDVPEDFVYKTTGQESESLVLTSCGGLDRTDMICAHMAYGKDIKVVACFDNADCGSGTCDKSGSWDTWKCSGGTTTGVTFAQLNTYANQWIGGSITFQQLIAYANQWANQQ